MSPAEGEIGAILRGMVPSHRDHSRRPELRSPARFKDDVAKPLGVVIAIAGAALMFVTCEARDDFRDETIAKCAAAALAWLLIVVGLSPFAAPRRYQVRK